MVKISSSGGFKYHPDRDEYVEPKVSIIRKIMHHAGDFQGYSIIKPHQFAYRILITEIFPGSTFRHYNAVRVQEACGGITFFHPERKDIQKGRVDKIYSLFIELCFFI